MDRERVMSNLAILRTWVAVNPDYGIGLSVEDCHKAVKWLDAALELLKAQEPITPHMVDWGIYECPICKTRVDKTYKFCKVCGKVVKWE